jgi:hypothetical protein
LHFWKLKETLSMVVQDLWVITVEEHFCTLKAQQRNGVRYLVSYNHVELLFGIKQQLDTAQKQPHERAKHL